MSATIKGLGLFDVFPQPGFTATLSENGGWTARHTFAIRRTAWANASVRNQFAKGVSATALDSGLASFWAFLKVVSVEVTSDEGDFTMVSVELSGAQGATYGEDGLGAEAEPTYRLSGQLQDAPLSIHPKWALMDEKFKYALGEQIIGNYRASKEFTQVGTYDQDDFFTPAKDQNDSPITFEGDAIEFCKRIARGETTYLRPVITWTESAEGQTGLTNAQLNKLGNIATPRGNPPEAGGTRDWMLTSAFQEQTGELIRTDLEWTLSEKGGHDSFLYDE